MRRNIQKKYNINAPFCVDLIFKFPTLHAKKDFYKYLNIRKYKNYNTSR